MTVRRILAVDDEPDILRSLARLLPLLMDEVEVDAASGGKEALELLAQGPHDLLISDYKMPHMDGLELIARAHEAYPDLPAMLMTAHPDAQLAARARDAGVVAFFPKPFDMDALAETLEDHLK